MGYLVSYIVRWAAFEAADTGHAAEAAAASARARACSGVLRVGAAASGNTLIQTGGKTNEKNVRWRVAALWRWLGAQF